MHKINIKAAAPPKILKHFLLHIQKFWSFVIASSLSEFFSKSFAKN